MLHVGTRKHLDNKQYYWKNEMKIYHLLVILFLISSLPIKAEIILDGTLGSSGGLSGPDYLIGADLGRQLGDNLFHSFQDFNLNRHESATFSGPNTVQNILNRVTGGNPSSIDGLIRSTIPNADMYFLNPYGIMFGPNAQLNVQGSFHASTADYLRLGESGRFNTRNPSDSIFTMAPIASFGFLTDTPAPITTQDSDLFVFESETLSLIGGDLSLNGDSPLIFDEQGFMAVFARSKLSAPAGRVNLASVASKGEVIPSEFGLNLNAEGGQITANNTLIDTSGRGGGSIFIRGGQLIMDDAVVQTNTLADKNGKGIDILLTDSMDISSRPINTSSHDNSAVYSLVALSSSTFGSGHAGTITISTPILILTETTVRGITTDIGNAADIIITTQQMTLKEASVIENGSYSMGTGGDITIVATKSLLLEDKFKLNSESEGNALKFIREAFIGSNCFFNDAGDVTIFTGDLTMKGGSIAATSYGMGKAGNITIKANNAKLTNGTLIVNVSFNGKPGNFVNVDVEDTLSIIGKRPGVVVIGNGILVLRNNQTVISSITFGSSDAGNISISAKDLIIDKRGGISAATVGTGAAGNVTIKVEKLFLEAGGEINSGSGGLVGEQIMLGQGPGGHVHVNATDSITISGQDKLGLPSAISTRSFSVGQGGNIEVKTDHLSIKDDGAIIANAMGTGNAGGIMIQANTIKLADNGNISTSAEHATGGNITILVPNLLFLSKGQITTSVLGGTGKGGDIIIEDPTFVVVLNQGKIKAQADEGQGGNIRIVANQFIKSPESLISASSKLGVDGKVEVESPEMNLDEFLVVLPKGFSEAQLKQCSIQEVENSSTFKVDLFRKKLVPFVKDFK